MNGSNGIEDNLESVVVSDWTMTCDDEGIWSCLDSVDEPLLLYHLIRRLNGKTFVGSSKIEEDAEGCDLDSMFGLELNESFSERKRDVGSWIMRIFHRDVNVGSHVPSLLLRNEVLVGI